MPSPAPSPLLLSSPLYTHVVSPALRPLVCDHCLARPGLWDHLPPPPPPARCARCKVSHYCGAPCQRAAWRAGHKGECTYLQAVAPRVPPSLVMLMLRTLFRHGREEGHREAVGGRARGLEDLLTHSERVRGSRERAEAYRAFLPVVARCVGARYTEEQVWRVYCAILINSAEVTDGLGQTIGTGLSLGLSSIDHSCAPNSVAVYRGREVEVRGLPGEQATLATATISYLSTVLPRCERRERLEEQYYFTCTCSLCSEEGEEVVAGAARCRRCGCAVAVCREVCSCGEEVAGEARVAGAFLTPDTSVAGWRALAATYHVTDWRMVDMGEAVMAAALDKADYSGFVEVGEALVAAYRAHLHPYSPSLALHLAKVAKALIHLGREREGLEHLVQAATIFQLVLGEEAALVGYCRALRDSCAS